MYPFSPLNYKGFSRIGDQNLPRLEEREDGKQSEAGGSHLKAPAALVSFHPFTSYRYSYNRFLTARHLRVLWQIRVLSGLGASRSPWTDEAAEASEVTRTVTENERKTLTCRKAMEHINLDNSNPLFSLKKT